MLCLFIRTSGRPAIYINPLKVCMVEQSAATGGALITFDNGGAVTVQGTPELAAEKIGDAIKKLHYSGSR
jgi:hypothetical protein